MSAIAWQSAEACSAALFLPNHCQVGKRLRGAGAMHHNRASFWFRIILAAAANENVIDCVGEWHSYCYMDRGKRKVSQPVVQFASLSKQQ
ncbi:hypothetical protein [Pantoea sp. SORGH_AS_0659]|uniref:hypothetical protein n=1 Tax=Pantoea sp. SORGH_AS_0659 TaxID=3062597 RepID=UPI002856693F|nr:hypothetical protein [Pantoea sp. SORGH_AS_0659]MDR6349896.1 hypothetical protein [Pantoea sp. SORGH_AS_0659]